MHLTEAVLAPLRERYGEPRALRWVGEVSAEEFTLAGGSPERRHDVTFFVFDAAERLALIQKPSYTDGVWRPPGGGVRPGVYGETDDFGYNIVKDPVHVHDFHATLLHLMGINHEQLTFKHLGRRYRLTDVEGNVIKGLIS